METTGPCAPQHGEEAPSPWIRRWSHLLQPGGTVLDVACGAGRHMRWFNQRGHPVTGVDRSAAALCALDDIGTQVERIEADIENAPWPLMQQGRPRDFNAVVVTNYLWRPLWPVLLQSVAPGGVLLYETFSVDHASIGRPAHRRFRRWLPAGSATLRATHRRNPATPSGNNHQPQTLPVTSLNEWATAAGGRLMASG